MKSFLTVFLGFLIGITLTLSIQLFYVVHSSDYEYYKETQRVAKKIQANFQTGKEVYLDRRITRDELDDIVLRHVDGNGYLHDVYIYYSRVYCYCPVVPMTTRNHICGHIIAGGNNIYLIGNTLIKPYEHLEVDLVVKN